MTESNDLYSLFLVVFYENGNMEIIEGGSLGFQSGTHDWYKAQLTREFVDNIDFIIPGMKMTGSSTGTAWFDSFFIHVN